ncbi:MAG: HPF/RaiA family ribosome-associated protein [Thermoanaerobaculia bacterium]
MPFPLQVQFLELPRSDLLEAKIRKKFEGLERYSASILACHVWVEKPLGHHRKGLLFDVQVRLTVPGEDLIIVAQPPEDDVSVAIRNAFDAMRRRLQDYERRRRARLKAHPRRRARTTAREQPEADSAGA